MVFCIESMLRLSVARSDVNGWTTLRLWFQFTTIASSPLRTSVDKRRWIESAALFFAKKAIDDESKKTMMLRFRASAGASDAGAAAAAAATGAGAWLRIS